MEKSSELEALCGVVTIMAIIGTLGNSLILLVYSRKRGGRATNIFIRTLAALDLIICVFVMPYTIVYEYKVVNSQFACKVFELARHFNVIMSNLTLVAVAAERYVAICKPTFSVLDFHVRRGVSVMVLFSIVFSVPSMWVFAVLPAEININNTTQATPENTTASYSQLPLRNISHFPETIGTYCRFTTSILGPLNTLMYQGFQTVVWFSCIFGIVILYALIYRAVWKRDRVRNSTRVTPSVWVVRQADADRDQSTSTTEGNPNKKGLFLGTCFSHSRQNSQPKILTRMQSEISSSSNTVDLESIPQQACQIVLQKKVERRINAHRKTGTMLFLCTVIYIVTWTPFFLDIFGATDSLVFRHTFFISNASNPIIYGIVNKQVRTAMYCLLRGKKVRR